MKNLGIFILLIIPICVFASMPPVSGVFSISEKVVKEYEVFYGSITAKSDVTINLIVTANDEGQQFFIQCFKDDQAGFGVLTTFLNKQKLIANIDAGPECPAKEFRVELDFEDATLRYEGGWILLMRGPITIPFVDF